MQVDTIEALECLKSWYTSERGIYTRETEYIETLESLESLESLDSVAEHLE
jgi:hypothetical protein